MFLHVLDWFVFNMHIAYTRELCHMKLKKHPTWTFAVTTIDTNERIAYFEDWSQV